MSATFVAMTLASGVIHQQIKLMIPDASLIIPGSAWELALKWVSLSSRATRIFACFSRHFCCNSQISGQRIIVFGCVVLLNLQLHRAHNTSYPYAAGQTNGTTFRAHQADKCPRKGAPQLSAATSTVDLYLVALNWEIKASVKTHVFKPKILGSISSACLNSNPRPINSTQPPFENDNNNGFSLRLFPKPVNRSATNLLVAQKRKRTSKCRRRRQSRNSK